MRLIDADLLEKEFIKDTPQGCGTVGIKYIDDLIKKQPTIEVPQWIPCSDRLPEIYEDSRTSEIVLVLGYDKEIDYEWQAMGWYADKTKQWYFAECKNTDKQIDWIDIIAWQPLPSVWKGENNAEK